jgi:hypothetical protein
MNISIQHQHGLGQMARLAPFSLEGEGLEMRVSDANRWSSHYHDEYMW